MPSTESLAREFRFVATGEQSRLQNKAAAANEPRQPGNVAPLRTERRIAPAGPRMIRDVQGPAAAATCMELALRPPDAFLQERSLVTREMNALAVQRNRAKAQWHQQIASWSVDGPGKHRRQELLDSLPGFARTVELRCQPACASDIQHFEVAFPSLRKDASEVATVLTERSAAMTSIINGFESSWHAQCSMVPDSPSTIVSSKAANAPRLVTR